MKHRYFNMFFVFYLYIMLIDYFNMLFCVAFIYYNSFIYENPNSKGVYIPHRYVQTISKCFFCLLYSAQISTCFFVFHLSIIFRTDRAFQHAFLCYIYLYIPHRCVQSISTCFLVYIPHRYIAFQHSFLCFIYLLDMYRVFQHVILCFVYLLYVQSISTCFFVFIYVRPVFVQSYQVRLGQVRFRLGQVQVRFRLGLSQVQVSFR